MDFTWCAEDYYQHSEFQYNHAQKAIAHHNFIGTESVLDVGCGDGKITAEIAMKLESGFVIGIDSSPQMIDFARETFQHKHANLTFNVCQAEKIPYLNKFDLVVSFACLHWVKDQLAFLIGAKNALKKDGKIIITLYPKHPDIWESIENTVCSPDWMDFFYEYENPHISYDIESYRSLAAQAGLKIKYLAEETPIAYFKSKKYVEHFLQSWLPHTSRITTESNKNKFIKEIVSNFLEKCHATDSKNIGVPFRRLDVVLESE